MIDSHCHLNDERFDEDRDLVLSRAAEAGVTHAVVVGYDLASSRRAVELANRTPQGPSPNLAAVVGVSTHLAAEWSDTVEEEIRQLLGMPGVVGLGETGLDFFYPEPAREIQERSLAAQLEIANELGIPVVFHLREAATEFFAILDRARFTGPGVLHCFTGDERAMREGVARGLLVSFSGIVTFKKAADLLGVAKVTPLRNLLVETDAPYLAPAPHRGKRCEPSHVIHTAELLIRARGEDPLEFAQAMESNLLRLFPKLASARNQARASGARLV
ncbi:MAG: TatD family hydrolase [Candidatus Omnitrophica bacterium]|nr:putative metal-dependent hydrolase YcfH [bacterium]NUN95761.1 TatD family hydrolase [Candidatus Omnitrophota bacterium]